MYERENARTLSSNDYRWTVLPPNFFDMLHKQDIDATRYADGSTATYPPFWEIDTVGYINFFILLYPFFIK